MERTVTPLTREDWNWLVKLPGRVVVAATSAQADSARHTVHEGLAGIDAIAAGRASASRLVREVVAAIYHEPDEDRPVAEEFLDRAAGIAGVLADCRDAGRLLTGRVDRADADAYRHWLVAIATRVCHAARTGGLLGIRGGPEHPQQTSVLPQPGAHPGRGPARGPPPFFVGDVWGRPGGGAVAGEPPGRPAL